MKNILFILMLVGGFHVFAQTTYVPDDNFEQALIDLGLDTDSILNDSVLTAAIDTVQNLQINAKAISDLTGLEDFINLRILNCQINSIITLDVSANVLLEQLYCQGNDIYSLDLSDNLLLTHLHCGSNDISNLDLSSNAALMWVDCSWNLLDSLSLGNKPVLNFFKAQYNQLISLDASNCSVLKYLVVNNNSLTSLNFKNGNNTIVTLYKSINNPNLTCVDVDDANYSAANWLNIDTWSAYSTNCTLAGCMDVLACNYNALAWLSDSSCTYSSTSLNTIVVCDGDSTIVGNSIYTNAGSYTDTLQAVNGCDSIVSTILTVNVVGCTDSTAFNYDPNAICDDSSCIATVYGCMDSTATNYNATANTDDGSCYTCSISVSSFYNPPSNLQTCNGFIILTPVGAAPYTYTWSNGATSEINPGLCDDVYMYTVIDDNGCGFTDTIVLTTRVGCTDPNAFNYDSTAIYDDGSCISYIYGCTDSLSINYNLNANVDNGSCTYCDISFNQFTIGSNSTGNCDGWIFVNANSSFPPVTYLLNNNPTPSFSSGMCSGLYTIVNAPKL